MNKYNRGSGLSIVILVLALATVAGGGYWYYLHNKIASTVENLVQPLDQQTLSKASEKAPTVAKINNLSAVAVQITAPAILVKGKEYTINYGVGKSIVSVEINLTSVSENGHQIFTTQTVNSSGSFKWKVPNGPLNGSYDNDLLEGIYNFEIVGKTAEYDQTAKKIDDIIHKSHPTESDMREYINLQEKLKTMKATAKSNKFTVSEKDLIPINSSSLSKIVGNTNSFAIRYEWVTLPTGVSVGSQLKFFYTNHSAMTRDCIVNRDSSTGVYFCYIPWSSSLANGYDQKTNWMIFIEGSLKDTATERDQKRIIAMKKLGTALQQYKNSNENYPCQKSDYPRCTDQSSIYGQSNVVFPNFQNVHYEDPLGEKDKNYKYFYATDRNSFLIYAQLENSFKDGDADFYCVDSQNIKVTVSKRPNPTINPLSCNNLWPD